VAIFPEDKSPVDQLLAAEIRSQLIEAMDNITEDPPLPRFDNTVVVADGFLLVTCSDQTSMDWLLKAKV